MRLESEKTYHIFNRGNNRENIFFEKRNYFFFLQRFRQYVSEHIDVLAYCLMPNHFHFLIKIREFQHTNKESLLTEVEKAFKDFFISYAKAINKAYDRTGSLFQYKFKRKEVSDDDYFSWLIFYIHSNPIKSGLAKYFEDWPYSSYKEILSNNSSLVHTKEALDWFGGEKGFIDFHNRNLEKLKEGKQDFSMDDLI